MSEPLCYKCKYRENVPGDAHSCCCYPGNDTTIFAILSQSNMLQAIKLEIKADAYGIRRGWFMWPINFDPVWLKSCKGYTPKEV